jgi:hypothetical protein
MAWLCFLDLLAGKVEAATGVDRAGTTLCDEHRRPSEAHLELTRVECVHWQCEGQPAWTVFIGEPLCIRHAIENRFGDDMREHGLFVDIYERLRVLGYPAAY